MNQLAIDVTELLAIAPALHLALRRGHWLSHLLTDHDAIDRCLALRHEIRTAAGHLERAPDTSSHHSTLVARGLLGVHERLRRDLLLVAHIDAQPGVLSVFELVVSFEIRYSWEQAMLLGELIIHCL